MTTDDMFTTEAKAHPLSPATFGRPLDVLVIGAGQAGLAIGYHLAQTGLSFQILDAGARVGQAWWRDPNWLIQVE
jgi:cation diffusion facilitator CzcD-associated flavoprotein CzcO